ncbi:enoyl-CoA hydratase/isomerase [Aliikangiella coralliicola]|uniref:Enoyl-CoA hydratase/isomerase n=1 Tax=Aliikangiella coralliicola TaxID=2592383 RepID=A0A545U943_9GAMM|nr:enoyl-CoA hydratase/isomerase [Aliikangiella coralliicola]TQV85997.1 enoyl-CoA hydratase/isomerase [Aliikangiella coralliicola]
MGILMDTAAYETLRVRFEEDICFIQIYRPDANNTINDRLIEEFSQVLDHCDTAAKIVVLEGLPEVFCFGADFQGLQQSVEQESSQEQNPEPLYDLWLKLASGPYITIAHVRGKANAGGIGFVAACDVVLSERQAVYSLSELLFGLMPACVLPFLIRRMGFTKSNYMTLLTQPISAEQAMEWGLVDACEEKSENLLRKHLLRLRRLSKSGVARYKRYMNALDNGLADSKSKALAANIEVFSDKENLAKITRYVTTGQFPWEGD